MVSLRCSWSIREDRFGRRRTRGRGRFPRASSKRAKNHWRPRSVSSRKRPAVEPRARSSRLRRSRSAVARLSTPGRWRATAIPRSCTATCFLWNGLRSRASISNSPKLTEPSGSRSRWHSRRSFPRNAGSSLSFQAERFQGFLAALREMQAAAVDELIKRRRESASDLRLERPTNPASYASGGLADRHTAWPPPSPGAVLLLFDADRSRGYRAGYATPLSTHRHPPCRRRTGPATWSL